MLSGSLARLAPRTTVRGPVSDMDCPLVEPSMIPGNPAAATEANDSTLLESKGSRRQAARFTLRSVISVHLNARTLAHTRLALSPASEAVAWLRLAANGQHHPVFGDPGTDARFALRHPDVALVAQSLPTGGTGGYTPDLLTPKPPIGTSAGTFGQQLELMAHTPADVVAYQLGVERFPRDGMPAGVRAAVARGTFARRAANGLLHFWRAAFGERWSRLRVTLDIDLATKTAAIGATGIGRVLGSLHPDVHWTGTHLLIASTFRETFDLAGEELVLCPSAVGWSRVTTQCCDPSDAVLVYPAGGLDCQRPPATGLAELLGPSRAAILHDLDIARSTSELSARRNLSPATVSHHLGVLLRAGLVLRRREQRRVLYRRTEQGDILLGLRGQQP